MVGIKADPSAQLVFASSGTGKLETLKFADDFAAWTKRVQRAISIDADVVFVGYGVVAPEYHWDDFKGVNVKGKVRVVLINGPPVPNPKDPSKLDGMNMLGRTKDIEIVGLGQSTLDDIARAVAAEQGRVVTPDAEPEEGFHFRSDHLNFAKQGVPALDALSGVEYIGKPPGWGLEMRDKYTREDYHKPSDKIKPYWDLSGAVEDLYLLGEVGYRVANAQTFPAWKPGSEFKAKR
jgi:Zn-dependent M28 family amino/carboxypeptidase